MARKGKTLGELLDAAGKGGRVEIFVSDFINKGKTPIKALVKRRKSR